MLIANKPCNNAALFTDGIHPNQEGAALLAETAYAVLKVKLRLP